MARFYADDPDGERKTQAIERFGEDMCQRLWNCGVAPWDVHLEWRADGTMRRLELLAVYGARGIAGLLAHPSVQDLEVLAVDDPAIVPFEWLATHAVHTLIVGARDTRLQQLVARKLSLAAFDPRPLLAAMPQLHTLVVAAKSIELADTRHDRLATLVIATECWPLVPSLELPALESLAIAIDGELDAGLVASFDRVAPALTSLVLQGSAADDLLLALPDVLPPRVEKLAITSEIAVTTAAAIARRPGRLERVSHVTFGGTHREAKQWLACLSGEAVERVHKLDKARRWAQLFERATEPPDPAIVVDGAFAFLPNDPIERSLRACQADPQVALVYADWLEERGFAAMAKAIRNHQSLAKNPAFAVEHADDRMRDTFREAVFLLLDAWRQRSPLASSKLRERGTTFRERAHALLQSVSTWRVHRRDTSRIEPHLPPAFRELAGPLRRSLPFDAFVGGEAQNGWLLYVTTPAALASLVTDDHDW